MCDQAQLMVLTLLGLCLCARERRLKRLDLDDFAAPLNMPAIDALSALLALPTRVESLNVDLTPYAASHSSSQPLQEAIVRAVVACAKAGRLTSLRFILPPASWSAAAATPASIAAFAAEAKKPQTAFSRPPALHCKEMMRLLCEGMQGCRQITHLELLGPLNEKATTAVRAAACCASV